MLFFNALPETGGAQAARLIVHLEHCRVTVLFPGSRPAAAFTVQPQLHFVSSGIHIYHPMVFRMLCIQPCLVAAPDDFPISALGRDFPGHRDIRVVGQPPGIIRHMGGRSAMGHVLAGDCDAIVLFLSLQDSYLDQLLSSYDHQDELQRFFFHALRRQRKEQSYLHLQPAAPLAPSHVSPNSPWQLSRILETLIEEDYFPAEGSGEIIRGNLIRLLSLLCRRYSMKLHSSDRESREKALLYELERYIRLHFATVTSRELETTFHYHRNYYNLLLQKYLGVSFQEYLQDIRMKQAAGLLRSTRLPVRDIALAAGYHNSSHFHHLFQRHFGMSQTEDRKSVV